MKVVHIEETSTVAKAEMGFWQHACGKKSLTKFDLLLNGVQKHTINPPSTGWGQRTKVRVPSLYHLQDAFPRYAIGYNSNYQAVYGDFLMRDLAIWTDVLTDAEIRQVMKE